MSKERVPLATAAEAADMYPVVLEALRIGVGPVLPPGLYAASRTGTVHVEAGRRAPHNIHDVEATEANSTNGLHVEVAYSAQVSQLGNPHFIRLPSTMESVSRRFAGACECT